MEQQPHYANHLVDQPSLYLRQHAYQPVDWYPWGPAALEKARAEDKPILLSIGYSSCHWCHVMAHESFDNPQTARLMNASYVNIKVDREERPDLDEVFMAAVQAMTGQGGWPMTLFLTPDGRPFYAGTYFPPQDRYGMPGFPRLLAYLAQRFRERRADIEKIGAEVAGSIQTIARAGWTAGELTPALFERAVGQLLDAYDEQQGGFGAAPKFPQPVALQLLMRVASDKAEAMRAVRHTLDQMAAGGMYDLVGGGFHRYSVDDHWHIPHFEKMLYDNALLAPAYLEGYRLTGEEGYRRVAEQTCDYLLREMRLPGGGFAAAQDADTAEGEGRYFSWSEPDFCDALSPEDAGWAVSFFGVTSEGNFEHGLNVLHQSQSWDDLARQLQATPAEAVLRVDAARARLLEARGRRTPPARDDKALADWNGLAIRALAKAASVLGRSDYLDAARAAAEFVLGEMRSDGRLGHFHAAGSVVGEGFLDDYSHMVAGLIALYRSTRDAHWLTEAGALTDQAIDLFWDAQDGGFFFSGERHATPLARPKRYVDMPTPSGNSMMAFDLVELGALLEKPAYRALAEQTMGRFAQAMGNSGQGLAQMLLAYALFLYPDRDTSSGKGV